MPKLLMIAAGHSAVLDCIGITVEAISPPKSREGVCQNSPCASIRRHQDHRDPAAARQNPGTVERLTREAIEISTMAEELSARGLQAEAVTFALAAAERLRAVRALSKMAAP
jgi:hypothetical protein